MPEKAVEQDATAGGVTSLRRWGKRGLVLAGALFLALLVFAVAGGLWLQHRGNVLGDRALAELQERGLPTRLSAISAPVEDEQAARRAASYFAAAGMIAQQADYGPPFEEGRKPVELGAAVPAELASDIAGYVADHDAIYELVEQARGQPEYLYELEFPKENARGYEILSSFRSLAWILATRSLLHQSRGDGEEALRDCAAILEICRSLDSEPWVFTRLMRANFNSIAFEQIEQTLSRTTPGVKSLSGLQKRCLREMDVFDLTEPLRREFAAFAEDIRHPKRHGFKTLWELQRALTSQTNAEKPDWVARMDLNALCLIVCPASYKRGPASQVRMWLPYYDAAKRGGAELATMAREREKQAQAPLQAKRAAIARSVLAQESARAKMSVAAAALAVEAHYRRHGRWPESLSEAGVKEPQDPLGDGPLRYQKTSEGRMIYSVGQNGIDNGGVENYSQDADDIVLNLLGADRRGHKQPGDSDVSR